MNPLIWKREHQLALAIAAAVGCVGGLVFAHLGPNSSHWRFCFFGTNRLCLFDYDWGYESLIVNWGSFVPILIVAGWALLGAILGAAVVYTRQLMR